MTFLDDLWKKFKTEDSNHALKIQKKEAAEVPAVLEKDHTSQKTPLPKASVNVSMLENSKQVLEHFEENEIENLGRQTVLDNLKALKVLVDQPKEDKPELRFTKIKQHLGEPECYETVRQERWYPDIHCPKCNSNHLQQLPQVPPHSLHKHRYRCLDCATDFNDDSGTPIETGIPPINIWMQCWYLMGCTDSLAYIAAKLNMDLTLVESMVHQLQKLFHSKKPLTRFLDFEEWSKQSQHLREQLKDDLLRQYERLNANIATAPKDTAEFRRQQNIRRGLNPTAPPSPTPGKKR